MKSVSVLGRGLDDLMTVNLARYKPTGEHIAIRRIDLESCTNDMVTYLQVCISIRSHVTCFLFAASQGNIYVTLVSVLVNRSPSYF